MSWDTFLLDKAFNCNGAVTRYRAVMGHAEGIVKMPTGAGVLAVGVATDDATTGHDVNVRILGIAMVTASAAISAWDRVSIGDVDGKIRTAVGGDYILGIALQAASAEDDIIPVLVVPSYSAVDDGSVTTAKIVDANVTHGKLAANAVETDNIKDANVTAAKLAAALAALIQGTPTFTIGAEAADKINVAVQLNDSNAAAIAAKHSVNVWLSDAAGGAECAVAPSGAVAINTDGVIINSHTAKLNMQIVTSAAGKFDLDITEAGAKTLYVNVEYQGKVYSSGAVTFAA